MLLLLAMAAFYFAFFVLRGRYSALVVGFNALFLSVHWPG